MAAARSAKLVFRYVRKASAALASFCSSSASLSSSNWATTDPVLGLVVAIMGIIPRDQAVTQATSTGGTPMRTAAYLIALNAILAATPITAQEEEDRPLGPVRGGGGASF